MSQGRHTKHKHRVGTRDKGRNTGHKYVSESHLTDPSAHVHIRTIPAPDRTVKSDSQVLPRGFSVAVNEGGPRSRAYAYFPAPPASMVDPNAVTFASKLRGSAPAAMGVNGEGGSNIAAGAAAEGYLSAHNRLPNTIAPGHHVPRGAPSPLSLLPTGAPAKVVFTPRSASSSIRAPVDAVPSLIQRFGSPTPTDTQKIDATGGKDGPEESVDITQKLAREKEEEEEKNYAIQPATWSQVHKAVKQAEKRVIEANISSMLSKPSRFLDTPLDAPRLEQPTPHQMAPPGILQSSKETTTDGFYLGSAALGGTEVIDCPDHMRFPPPIDTSGRRGGISLGSNSRLVSSTELRFTGRRYRAKERWYEAPVHSLSMSNTLQSPYADCDKRPACLTVGVPADTCPESEDPYMCNEGERQKFYNMANRNSLIHRIETLDLSQRNPVNFEVAFNPETHKQSFDHPEFHDGVFTINGTGTWGVHNIDMVRRSPIRHGFDQNLEILGQRYPNSRWYAIDLNHFRWSQPGIARVRVFGEGEKARLTIQSSGEKDVNPLLLPYRNFKHPGTHEVLGVFSVLFKNWLPYKSKDKEDNYFSRIPKGDPGLTAPNTRTTYLPPDEDPMFEKNLRDYLEERKMGPEFYPIGGFPSYLGNPRPDGNWPSENLKGRSRYQDYVMLPTRFVNREMSLVEIMKRQPSTPLRSRGTYPPGLMPPFGSPPRVREAAYGSVSPGSQAGIDYDGIMGPAGPTLFENTPDRFPTKIRGQQHDIQYGMDRISAGMVEMGMFARVPGRMN